MKPAEPVEEIVEEEHTYNKKDKAAIAPTYEEVPTIDGRKSSWAKLAEQYECLDELNTEGYPLSTKRKAQLPVRMLKVAQAITDGNYSAERLLQLAELTFASKNCKYENLKGIEGIDHAILVNIMNADWLSNKVKMPKVLAGCNKVEKSIIAEKADTEGAKNAPVGSAEDRIMTSAGSKAKYYARFDGGTWIEYSDMKSRNDAVAEFKKKYPNATIEKRNKE